LCGIVRHRIHAARSLVGDVRLVRMDGVLVRRDRVRPAADADVDVRRHVHQVTGTRHQRGQALRAVHCTLRVRRLDGVDVVVARTRMIRPGGQDSLEIRHYLGRAGTRLQVAGPVVPRTQVHHGFGMQRHDVVVIRKALPSPHASPPRTRDPAPHGRPAAPPRSERRAPRSGALHGTRNPPATAPPVPLAYASSPLLRSIGALMFGP
jgi:hypothetical protein